VVDPHAQAGRLEGRGDALARVVHLGLVAHGDDDRLDRGESRRHDESVVVTVEHDEPADHARRGAPGTREAQFGLTFFALEVDVEGPREVLTEFVARRHLQRLAVTHHAFGGHRVDRASEAFAGRLDTEVRGGREHVLQEIVVDLEVDLRGEGVGVLVTRVRRVTFLPQELRGA
jgi:hypothetical protein